MKYRVIFVAVACILGFASEAFAQKVRRYDQPTNSGNSGNNASGSANTGNTASRVYYPGEPLPTGNSNQQATAAPEGEKTGTPTGSYVTVFNRAYQRKRGLALNLPQEKLYRGIIPGTRDDMPHLQRARSKSGNRLTWIGFQPKENGARIFIQTSQNPNFDVSDDGTTITVILSDTKIPLRNFRRFIDTTYFKRNVTRIESKQVSSDVVLTITLKEAARPDVDKEGNYVYLDF